MAAPMGLRTVWASLAASTLLAATACGGSSSETPPPLEPDPEGFRYAGTKMPRPTEDAKDEDGDDEEDEDFERPRAKPAGKKGAAPSTWGKSDGEPAPAPTLK